MLPNTSKTLPPSIKTPKFIKILAKISYIIPAKLSVLIADKMFITPVKFRIPEREQTMRKSAQINRIKIHSINKEIDVLSYGYSKKKVLLVHGWCGRGTQFYMIADKLLENGYMVITFDAPAHGNSEGKTTFMPEFVEVIKQLEKDFGSFESAIGHSLGGMALYNAKKDITIKSLVTIGAGDTITEIIDRFIFSVGIKQTIAGKLKSFYDKKLNLDIDTHSSYIQAKNIKTPTLIIHDSLDGDVSVNCAKNIRGHLQNGTLLITNGLGHVKILRDKHTVNRIVDFIKQHK